MKAIDRIGIGLCMTLFLQGNTWAEANTVLQTITLLNQTHITSLHCFGIHAHYIFSAKGAEMIVAPGHEATLKIPATETSWVCGPTLDTGDARYEAFTLTCQHINPVETHCIAAVPASKTPPKTTAPKKHRKKHPSRAS